MTQATLDFDAKTVLQTEFQNSVKDLEVGLEELAKLIDKTDLPKEKVYGAWHQILSTTYDLHTHRITWIWQTLRTDQNLIHSSIIDESIFSFSDLQVLPCYSWLTLNVLKNKRVKQRPIISNQEPPVLVQLSEDLYFKSGKSGKMECKDCECHVYIPFPTQSSNADLARTLSVSEDTITSESFNEKN